jgi:uncharacterized membrane protein required for colicin V production
MNIIDLAILFMMGMSMILGVYNGSILSALHAVSFFLSWIVAVIFYPVLTKIILGIFPQLIKTIAFYVDGAELIPNVEDRMARASQFTQEQIIGIVDKINLPNPFNRLLVAKETFNSVENMATLGEYFDSTMAAIILNITSFVILFLLVKLLLIIIISIVKTVRDLPVLKRYDGLVGAGLGLIRGFFMISVIFALVPIITALAPADFINEYLNTSAFYDFFYKTNMFTNFVRSSL